jgi:hypothetical protein
MTHYGLYGSVLFPEHYINDGSIWKRIYGSERCACIPVTHQHHHPRDSDVHWSLCRSAPADVCYRSLCKEYPTKFALLGMCSGALVWFWTVFTHKEESKPIGLCQQLFGNPALLSLSWTVVDLIVIALPISAMVMIVPQMQKPGSLHQGSQMQCNG